MVRRLGQYAIDAVVLVVHLFVCIQGAWTVHALVGYVTHFGYSWAYPHVAINITACLAAFIVNVIAYFRTDPAAMPGVRRPRLRVATRATAVWSVTFATLGLLGGFAAWSA
jgi:uncharacterized membrane protein (DUF106 family)